MVIAAAALCGNASGGVADKASGQVDFADLQADRSYSGARAYNQSKLANLLSPTS